MKYPGLNDSHLTYHFNLTANYPIIITINLNIVDERAHLDDVAEVVFRCINCTGTYENVARTSFTLRNRQRNSEAERGKLIDKGLSAIPSSSSYPSLIISLSVGFVGALSGVESEVL
jgi:hypothetical protein